MNGRKRKVQIKFYVTEEERALIEQKMKLVPTRNMAAYLRKIAIDGYIIQTDHSDIKGMTYPVFLSTRKTAIASSTPLLHICYAVEQRF